MIIHGQQPRTHQRAVDTSSAFHLPKKGIWQDGSVGRRKVQENRGIGSDDAREGGENNYFATTLPKFRRPHNEPNIGQPVGI